MSAADQASGHMATAEVPRDARAAFAFLADPARLGHWALGCWQTEEIEPGLFRGHSLFDGGEVWVRIDADPGRLIVDYLVGGSPHRLVPRIMARVVPGPVTGRSDSVSLVSLCAWRGVDMDDARWLRLRATHEAEILLIAGQIARLDPEPGGA